MSRTVTIFGSATVSATDAIYADAYALGQAIAGCGWQVCNGGYGGTMEAASHGAREAGGTSCGATLAALDTLRGGPNPYIDEVIPHETLLARVETLIQRGDAHVVLPGGTGTLLELAAAWELKSKRFADADKPLLLLGDFWQPMIDHVLPQHAIPDAPAPLVCASVEEVIEHLRRAWNP